MTIEASPYLITPKLAQAIDKWTIDKVGIPSFTLMELAGSKAASQFIEDFPQAQHLLLLIGKGNNAGDGLVMARHLLLTNSKIEISVVLVFSEIPTTADAAKNWELLNSTDTSYKDRIQVVDSAKLTDSDFLKSFDFCVDAVFGVGLSKEVKAPISTFFNALNASKIKIVALDVPSGLNAENGIVLGEAVRADATFTFGYDKIGFYLNDAHRQTGVIRVLELGYDLTAFLARDEQKQEAQLCAHTLSIDSRINNDEQKGAKIAPKHKYDGGAVLIIGSSEGLTGATISVAQAAWAAGASAVFLILPKGLSTIFEIALPNAVKWLVGDANDLYLSDKHLNEVKSHLNNYNKRGSICIGPGLGIEKGTQELINELLPDITQALVLDADVLKALNSSTKLPSQQDIVLTPHIGEWKTMQKNFGTVANSAEKVTLEDLQIIQNFAVNNQVHLLRKGSPSVFSTKRGKLYITKEPHLLKLFNKTGFGDVLSGLIATALVRFTTAENAVIWSLQMGLKAANEAHMNKQTFFPETIVAYVKSEE